MNHLQQRFLLFLVGCIGIRSLFVIIAKYINTKYLKYLGYLALLPAIGFIYIYLTGSRKTGAEVFGEKIWWNDLRPVHGLLYLLFILLHIFGFLLGFKEDKKDKIAVTIGLAYMNNGMAIVLAAACFKPSILVLTILSELPWNTLLGPYRKIMSRI